jgi:hypothetical protein
LTACCVAEKTDEKKLDACGCVSEPPGVLASSIAGVNGLNAPLEAVEADLRRRTAAADGGAAPVDPNPNLELPTGRRVPNKAGLACVGLGMTGVGGVMNVVGVPTAGGVTSDCVSMRGDTGPGMVSGIEPVCELGGGRAVDGDIDASVLSGKGCSGLVLE